MDDLTYTLRLLCKRNRDGSHATQADRQRSLNLAARQLREAGFRQMRATSLKGKHVEALLQRWQAEGLSAGTLKNRMAHLRWWAEKVGKAGILPTDNTKLGIPERRYVTNKNKARELGDRLDRASDPHVRMSLRLQAAFGLCREESIKFGPAMLIVATTSPSRDQGIMGQGRARPEGADHDAGAAHSVRRGASAGRPGLANPGEQDLHPATAPVRRAVQGGWIEQHARIAASVCTDAV